jgi:hypothetical protein
MSTVAAKGCARRCMRSACRSEASTEVTPASSSTYCSDLQRHAGQHCSRLPAACDVGVTLGLQLPPHWRQRLGHNPGVCVATKRAPVWVREAERHGDAPVQPRAHRAGHIARPRFAHNGHSGAWGPLGWQRRCMAIGRYQGLEHLADSDGAPYEVNIPAGGTGTSGMAPNCPAKPACDDLILVLYLVVAPSATIAGVDKVRSAARITSISNELTGYKEVCKFQEVISRRQGHRYARVGCAPLLQDQCSHRFQCSFRDSGGAGRSAPACSQTRKPAIFSNPPLSLRFHWESQSQIRLSGVRYNPIAAAPPPPPPQLHIFPETPQNQVGGSQ